MERILRLETAPADIAWAAMEYPHLHLQQQTTSVYIVAGHFCITSITWEPRISGCAYNIRQLKHAGVRLKCALLVVWQSLFAIISTPTSTHLPATSPEVQLPDEHHRSIQLPAVAQGLDWLSSGALPCLMASWPVATVAIARAVLLLSLASPT
jgi:hypothetical protein